MTISDVTIKWHLKLKTFQVFTEIYWMDSRLALSKWTTLLVVYIKDNGQQLLAWLHFI